MLFFTAVTNFLQAALFSTLAVNSPDVVAPEPEDDALEAIERAWYECSAAWIDGKRQVARVRVRPGDPDTCMREKLGYEDTGYRVSCIQLSKAIGCTKMVDLG
ncbi:hypothetical protein OV203_12580 [Nannocystis sp. ILAH1]|uniref:hypothetical protein n=1 Tax=unclassified Nannocystis TaxID=2627009 RepID=UPI002271A4E9|nr:MULTISPECIES: hypothetical protein [unclassified Nannocystis]MCY0987966.1 hypothetical protein [Nannocystis sp. ILAH1]MCY1065691.1 hypothetical protein [Nannocystis sp. RBIL2]